MRSLVKMSARKAEHSCLSSSPQSTSGSSSADIVIHGQQRPGVGLARHGYWLAQPTTVTVATNGTHTLRIQVREDGVAVDQIVLSPDAYLHAAPGPVSNDSTIVRKR
jgi:hypothetical protein